MPLQGPMSFEGMGDRSEVLRFSFASAIDFTPVNWVTSVPDKVGSLNAAPASRLLGPGRAPLMP